VSTISRLTSAREEVLQRLYASVAHMSPMAMLRHVAAHVYSTDLEELVLIGGEPDLDHVRAECPRFYAMCTPKRRAQLRVAVAVLMDRNGEVSSRTGMTAALAVQWCDLNGWGYVLTGAKGVGYHVKRGSRL
jgi:hypothetical protein